jgi:membrane-associated phospholipid phosphatase
MPAPAGRVGPSLLLVSAPALLGLLFALTLLLVRQRWAPLLGADHGARDGLHGYALAHPGFVTSMALVSGSGSALAWLVVLGVVAAWLAWRRLARVALFVVVTAAGSQLLNGALKAAVHRLRPVLAHPVAHEGGLSFPSGHAQGAMVGYGVLLVVLWPLLRGRWRGTALAAASVMVAAIGFSRVALGVHYLSDVVGGLLVGATWVALMVLAFNVAGARPAPAPPRP